MTTLQWVLLALSLAALFAVALNRGVTSAVRVVAILAAAVVLVLALSGCQAPERCNRAVITAPDGTELVSCSSGLRPL